LGVSKQRFPNPLSLPRISPGRVKTSNRIPHHSPLVVFFFLCFFLFLSYVFDSVTVGIPSAIPKFLLLYTFANSGKPARFLFPISLFLRSTLLRISRDPPIFVFVIELDVRTISYFLLLLILFLFFYPFLLVFEFGFIIFFALSLFPLSFLSIP